MNPLAVKYWEISGPRWLEHYRCEGISGPKDVSDVALKALSDHRCVMPLVWNDLSALTGVPQQKFRDYYHKGESAEEVHAALRQFIEIKEVNLNDYL